MKPVWKFAEQKPPRGDNGQENEGENCIFVDVFPTFSNYKRLSRVGEEDAASSSPMGNGEKRSVIFRHLQQNPSGDFPRWRRWPVLLPVSPSWLRHRCRLAPGGTAKPGRGSLLRVFWCRVVAPSEGPGGDAESVTSAVAQWGTVRPAWRSWDSALAPLAPLSLSL